MSAQPEVEALEQYQAIRPQAIELATALRSTRPREPNLMRKVVAFQTAAGVVGANDDPSGLYGPATLQALQFFLPPGTTAPPAWPGTRSGVWTPPAWVRQAQAAPPAPAPREPKSYAWVWWTLLASATAVTVVVIATKRPTATKTTEELIYARPWMYARAKGKFGRGAPSPRPRALPAGPTAYLLGY